MSGRLRVLELFCGIGGCAAALGDDAEVVAAVDIDQAALAVYAHNFAHPVENRTIESLPATVYRQWNADLWWLSPPCQPFTARGLRGDLADPRSAALLCVLEQLAEIGPPYVALENVPGFVRSQAHAKLLHTLEAAGYQTAECVICPSQWGTANRRRRYYLVASRDGLRPWERPAVPPLPLSEVLQPCDHNLDLPAADAARYRDALSIVDPLDPRAVASCFTAAYGRSLVRSGSYLATARGVRRFAPAEILRLLGFPAGYALPAGMSLRQGWRLAGNSLSIPAVRSVLSQLAL